ncbi:MAG: DUF998 domain-containing protein [Actinomycetota bacterium]|nr:DUF998 domain-containing protein [Actinomycetota bacterium]
MSEQAADWVSGRGEATGVGRGAVRGLAWLAIAGQVVFVAAWIVAGALDPGYSHAQSGVSALGADDAEHPWIVNGAIVVLGLSIAALGPALLGVLPRRRASHVAAALFALAGAAMALAGLFPTECDLGKSACGDRFEAGGLSWQTTAHLWTELVFQVAFIGTTFALARVLWPGPIAATALFSGLVGIAIAVASFAVYQAAGGDGGGIVQRVGWLATHAWVAIVAIGVLHRSAVARASELIPVGPREFFGRAWSGRGGFCLGAFYVARLAQPITFTRESRWIDDEHWIVEDITSFDNGYAIQRRMHAEMLAPDRARVVADDMPGGAELLLEEDGYRVVPARYRYAFPVGPVRFTLRCRDEVRVCEGGELLWTIRFSWLGIPAGVLRGRVRPV